MKMSASNSFYPLKLEDGELFSNKGLKLTNYEHVVVGVHRNFGCMEGFVLNHAPNNCRDPIEKR